ncbi:lipocalin-like domain-containing protein [Thiorhodococcus minor]|uniref:AttH domain-containing protein n=1 Tax=Thiorhodococcus minor TaxID=57489 RepID=A0A6M0JV88_9GAMM|nr:lipocalin-like domain-containing protein [Thiorhodococcus minor]NEV60974.1 hypothetical protein [Thiorhodococcus minor]
MSRPAKLWLTGVLIVGLMVALLLFAGAMRQRPQLSSQAISLRTLIDPGEGEFGVPAQSWQLSLPKDHGAHSAFQAELWTFLLWLRDERSRPLAVQVVLARAALTAQPQERQSEWAANQLYGAGVWAQGGRGSAPATHQRLQRAALGLAGSGTQPTRVWVDDWSFQTIGDTEEMRLQIKEDDLRLDVALGSLKTPLTETELGLFARAPDPARGRGYAISRLQVEGEVWLGGSLTKVSGTGWLDHLWGNLGTDALPLEIGRLIAQLDDGRELLCLELSRAGGGGRPIPSCALVLQDGRVQSFQRREIALERDDAAWRLAIPLLQLQLDLVPREMQPGSGALRSAWGMPILVSGLEAGRSVEGSGWAGLGSADWLR